SLRPGLVRVARPLGEIPQGGVGLPERRLGLSSFPDSLLRLAVPRRRKGMIEELVFNGGVIVLPGGGRKAVDHVVPRVEVRADILHVRVSARVVQVDLLAEHVRINSGLFELVRDHPSSRTYSERPIGLTSRS